MWRYGFMLLGIALLWSCSEPMVYQQFRGETMGTYYAITYRSPTNFQPQVDSLLKALNQEVSVYIPNSTISKFNQTDSLFAVGVDSSEMNLSEAEMRHFLINYRAARKVYERTNGVFDPTVMPLVNYWGFGYTPKRPVTAVDSMAIDSILQFVGMDKVQYSATNLGKDTLGVQLDFGALAKGYGVDELGRFLEAKGVEDYLVDIGGESRARGKNIRATYWTVGINTPKEEAGLTAVEGILMLKNKSVATSGNYRNFYEVKGIKYSHTINAKTGFPERNRLLSASVVANDCMTADAYATAFMAMGIEDAVDLVEALDEVDAHFIYSLPNGIMGTFTTEGLQEVIEKM